MLDVKILDFPTHAANLPVAMIPELRGDAAPALQAGWIEGPVMTAPPPLDAWPKLAMT